MQFTLTEEQRQLQSSVERFVRDHYGLESWRSAARGDLGFREELWQGMADMGWLGLAIPQEYGGLGLTARERGVVMEGLGNGLVLEPYWSTAVLGADLLLAAASEAQKHALLPRIADGSLRLAVALTEPGSRYDWTEVGCRAEREGRGWRLSGRKIAVLDAPSAGRLLLLARTGGDVLSMFCVDAQANGIVRRDFVTLDERRCSDIDLNGVAVDETDRLDGERSVLAPMQQSLDQALVALCAESVGAMAALVAATVEYLKTRRQFGKPLSEFQALRHRVADMVMATEQTRSLAMMAASGSGSPLSRMRTAAAAKAQAGQAGRFVGESAVQLHGGIGVSDELNVGHYLKRLMSIDYLLGDAPFHLKRFIDLDPELPRPKARVLVKESAQ